MERHGEAVPAEEGGPAAYHMGFADGGWISVPSAVPGLARGAGTLLVTQPGTCGGSWLTSDGWPGGRCAPSPGTGHPGVPGERSAKIRVRTRRGSRGPIGRQEPLMIPSSAVSALLLHHPRRVAARHAVNDDFAGALPRPRRVGPHAGRTQAARGGTARYACSPERCSPIRDGWTLDKSNLRWSGALFR